MAEQKKAGRPSKAVVEAQEEVVVESLVEKIESNIEIAKATTVKKVVRELDDEDMVLVASIASGMTQLRNSEKPFDEYYWNGFGSIEEVRYGTLVQFRKKSDEMFKTMLYVMDEQAIKELRLEKAYEHIGSLENLVKLFDKPAQEIVRFIDASTPELKRVLSQILFNKLERKEPIDYFVLKVLAEKLDIELSVDL